MKQLDAKSSYLIACFRQERSHRSCHTISWRPCSVRLSLVPPDSNTTLPSPTYSNTYAAPSSRPNAHPNDAWELLGANAQRQRRSRCPAPRLSNSEPPLAAPTTLRNATARGDSRSRAATHARRPTTHLTTPLNAPRHARARHDPG